MSLTASRPTTTVPAPCSPTQRITRSLLGYGVVAGPFYVVVSLIQALAHPGFDLTRHDWSLLAAGPYGWIQSANLILTGAMVVAFGLGLGRTPAGRWAPRLIIAYGVCLALAGMFTADPMAGYPVGVPSPAAASWHGLGHLVAGGLGFLAVIVAAFLLARRFARQGHRGLARWSRATGAVFLVGFAGVASGSGSPAVVLGFTAAVLAMWAWIAGVAVHHYRRADRPSPA